VYFVPRVARQASQPWALGHNAFGVKQNTSAVIQDAFGVKQGTSRLNNILHARATGDHGQHVLLMWDVDVQHDRPKAYTTVNLVVAQ
jgi:hypothetical protein